MSKRTSTVRSSPPRYLRAVLLDPCYRGRDIEDAAERLSCAVKWHLGFSTPTASLDPTYRGAEFAGLAGPWDRSSHPT
ncbi:hypothetical protein GCM10011509_26450 [Ornithinimicrobium pekingense]|uniref:Uncharacterized protein n=1 Tax=Ornithinimicrobium pekingense TaxID=384677 RepID=A0ABQ2FAY5_9MICO|nr:hypothetical protein GCM10011509_26450 [Ornithinimicrobium pekingense]